MSIELIAYAAFFLTMALSFAIICLGLNLQWGQTGLFNVGVAGFVAIGAYASALLTTPDDPNRFGGKVRWSQQDGDWQTVRERRPYTTNSRGIGLLDMAFAIDKDRPHRCSDAFALHVLEVMDKSLESAALGRSLSLTTTCERPAALSARLT